MLQVATSNFIVGKVTQAPSWRKRALRGNPGAFEPALVAIVTLTGGPGWLGPMIVWLDVTRLDAGVGSTSPSLLDPARDTMRRFLHRSNDYELAKLNEMRLRPPSGAALAALETFVH
jgi:hypothetical protein